MRLLLVTLTALATFSSASASAVTLRAVAGTLNLNCGYPNGDCNSNGCDGFASADRITCTAGKYIGCECGYGCGSETGHCNDNGCEGEDGRCTEDYLGCNCK